MGSIKRGDIFLVNFNPTLGAEIQKIRPVVVVSNDINNIHSPIVSIAPNSSSVSRIFSFEVEIPAGIGGLKVRSKILVNQTRAVDKIRLNKKLGHLPTDLLIKIDRALKLHYDFGRHRDLGILMKIITFKVPLPLIPQKDLIPPAA